MAVDLVADRTVRVGAAPGSGYIQSARNISGGSVPEGAVVVLSATGTNASVFYSFTTTTTLDDTMVMGVLVDGPVESGAIGWVMRQGFADKILVDGTTDIAAGDYLGTFTSAGIAAKTSSLRGAFAVALEAYTANDSNGKIKGIVLGEMAQRQVTFTDTANYALVAASDAPQALKNVADYVCDGTADDVQIQAALDALPAAGGTVELSDGSFSLAASVDLTDNDCLKLNATTVSGSIDELLSIADASGVSIIGINPDVSIIEQDGTGGQDAVVFNVSATTTETHALMRNVKVLGNASSGDGIRFDHGGASGAWQRVLLENVYSRDHGANGLEINPTMVDFTARDCWFRNNGENGVELVTTASKEWTTATFDKCYFMDNTEWGLLCTDGGSAAGNLVMLHHIVEGNGSGGITLDSVNGAELSGGHMEGNAGNTHIVVTGGNGIIAGHKLTTAATGIDFGSTNANFTILGNTILSLTTAAINFGTSTGEFHCLGNIISGNADDYAGGGSAAKLYTNDLSDDATGTGFGVPDSAELIHVSGDSDPTIRINAQSANSANSGKLAFGETDAGADQAWVKYDGSANKLLIETVNQAGALKIDRVTGMLELFTTNDAGRPSAGTAGRIFFNTDDGKLNIDDGTNWTLPDGTTT